MSEEKKLTEFGLLVPTNYLRAVAMMASRDGTRLAICGVRVEIEGKDVTLVGVDGRRLLAVRWQPHPSSKEPLAPEPLAFTVPLSMIKMLKPARSVVHTTIVERYADGTVGLDLAGSSRGMMLRGKQPGEGKFPDWRNVPPKGELKPVPELAFNPFMASEMVSAVMMLAGRKRRDPLGMQPWAEAGDARKPIVWHFPALESFLDVLAIQMPIRFAEGARAAAVPRWALAKGKEVAS
jgi:hypothetical protein